MSQVSGIRPFDKRDLADQLRGDPAALRHFLCSQRLAPPRGFLLGQVFERAPDNSQLSESREDPEFRGTKPSFTFATKMSRLSS